MLNIFGFFVLAKIYHSLDFLLNWDFKSGFWWSWSCPAKISPLNSAEDFAHINIMTVGFPPCSTTIIIAHQDENTTKSTKSTKQAPAGPRNHLGASSNVTQPQLFSLFTDFYLNPFWSMDRSLVPTSLCILARFTSFLLPFLRQKFSLKMPPPVLWSKVWESKSASSFTLWF